MRVTALVSLTGMTLMAGGSAMAAQNLVTDGGVDTPWVLDSNYDTYQDSEKLIRSNQCWEWFGATSWNLLGWDGTGGHRATNYYVDGQYGPTKWQRDFTSQWFDETAPHTPGVVPAYRTQAWIVTPGPISREEKTPGSGDYAARASWNWGGIHEGYVAGTAPTGTRIKLSVDYIKEGAAASQFKVYGFLNNNQARKPYFDWDANETGAALTDVIQPGPDYFCTWAGGRNTGQLILDANGGASVPTSATWTTYTESFTVPAPEAARVGGATNARFDNLMFAWDTDAPGSGWHAIDNLKMYVITPGDADEDGDVDGDDVAKWAVNFTGALTNPTTPKSWAEGDWDNDGDVDGDDVAKWAVNFTGALTGGLTVNAPGASPEAIAILEQMGINVAVPEPASLGLLALGSLAMLRRRRA